MSSLAKKANADLKNKSFAFVFSNGVERYFLPTLS
jgi:hypothetical protein